MIFAFNFTGSRDLDLAQQMRRTLKKYCKHLGSVESINMDGTGWGNGASWEASMMKLNALRTVLKRGITDTDYVLSVDSDVVFCSSEVFKYIHTYGIIGIQQEGKPTNTFIGHLSHIGGCSIYLRGDIAKKICAFNQDQLDQVRQQFKMYVLAEQEDVVISYLAKMVGAEFYGLPDHLFNGDFGQDIENKSLKSFYHLNFAARTFLGVDNVAKWDVPGVIERKGIVI
jgi:hypothetical protein